MHGWNAAETPEEHRIFISIPVEGDAEGQTERSPSRLDWRPRCHGYVGWGHSHLDGDDAQHPRCTGTADLVKELQAQMELSERDRGTIVYRSVCRRDMAEVVSSSRPIEKKLCR